MLVDVGQTPCVISPKQRWIYFLWENHTEEGPMGLRRGGGRNKVATENAGDLGVVSERQPSGKELDQFSEAIREANFFTII
jgi:hypothetical protein